MTTKYRNGVKYSTESARLVCTAPTDPPISLYCKKRKPVYFEICGEELEPLDIDDAKLFIEMWFWRDSDTYRQEFESNRWSRPKQINGRMYDPNKATLIGSNKDSDTSLYRKRTGEYFLYCMSMHKSTPVTYDDANAWAEKYLSNDIWKDEFGDIAQDDTDVIVWLHLPAHINRKLVRATSRLGKTKVQIISDLIDSIPD